MKTLTLDERDRQLRNKIASGVRVPAPGLLVNTGARRSQGKRDLLAAIRQRRLDEGKVPVFMANF